VDLPGRHPQPNLSAAFARPAFWDLNYHLSIRVRQTIEQVAFLKIRETRTG